MAKKNFKKGIDNIFSSTSPSPPDPQRGEFEEVKEVEEVKEASGYNGDNGVSGISLLVDGQPKAAGKTDAPATPHTGENAFAAYNIRYPKELQKRIKRFCIEHDVDMKDVFIGGAVMYMERGK
jgi:hypothetical protein